MPNPDPHDIGAQDKPLMTPEFAALQRRKSLQTLAFGFFLGGAGLAMGLDARAHGGTYFDLRHVELPWWWLAGAGVFILALTLLGAWRHVTRRD